VTPITSRARHRDAEEQIAQLFGPHAGLHDDAAVHLLADVDEDDPPRVKRSDRIAGRSGGAPACVSLHLQATQLAARSSSGGGNGGTPFRAAMRVGRGCKMGVDGRGVAEGCKQEGGQATCAPHPTGTGAKNAGPTPAHPVGPPHPARHQHCYACAQADAQTGPSAQSRAKADLVVQTGRWRARPANTLTDVTVVDQAAEQSTKTPRSRDCDFQTLRVLPLPSLWCLRRFG
jgi:hypothetical protein